MKPGPKELERRAMREQLNNGAPAQAGAQERYTEASLLSHDPNSHALWHEIEALKERLTLLERKQLTPVNTVDKPVDSKQPVDRKVYQRDYQRKRRERLKAQMGPEKSS